MAEFYKDSWSSAMLRLRSGSETNENNQKYQRRIGAAPSKS